MRLRYYAFAILLCLCLPLVACGAAVLAPLPKFRAFDADGNPLSGGKLYSYRAGSTTPQSTYTDAAGTTANANPVVLNTAGEANVWLVGSYKLILKDANDVTQWTVDNVSGSGGSGSADGATSVAGYVPQGASCVPAVSGNLQVTIPSCRAYVLNTTAPKIATYLEETTPSTFTLSGADGFFWILVNASTSASVAGWTRITGTHYLWKASATRPVTPNESLITARLVVSGAAVVTVAKAAPLTPYPAFGGGNVRNLGDYPIVADGSTAEQAAIQQLADELGELGGGTIIVPATASCYGVESPVFLRSNTTVQGTGTGSCVKNIRATAAASSTFWKNAVFVSGVMEANDNYGWFGQTYYALSNITQGYDTVTFTTPGQESNFAIGDVICLRTTATYSAGTDLTKPNLGEINEIVGIGSGTVTFKYAVNYAMTSPLIAECSRGNVTDTAIAVDGVTYPQRAVKRVRIDNLRVEGADFPADVAVTLWGGGCFECSFTNLWHTGNAFISFNGIARSTIAHVKSRWVRKCADLAMFSHNTVMDDVQCVQGTVSTAGNIGGILWGERTHNMTLRNSIVDMAKQTGNFSLIGLGTALHSVVEGNRLVALNIPDRFIVNMAADTSVPSEAVITSNSIWMGPLATPPVGAGIVLKDTNSVRVQNNVFHLVGTSPNYRAIWLRNTSTQNIISNNLILNDGIIAAEQTFDPSNKIHNNITRISQLDESIVQNSQTNNGSATYQTLKTKVIPAAAWNLGSRFCMTADGLITGTNNTKNVRVLINGAAELTLSWVAADTGSWHLQMMYGQRETVNAQILSWRWQSPFTIAATNYNLMQMASGTTAIDSSTTDITINLQARTASASDGVFFRNFTWNQCAPTEGW